LTLFVRSVPHVDWIPEKSTCPYYNTADPDTISFLEAAVEVSDPPEMAASEFSRCKL
jgi:hypothetical protein